MIPSQRQYEMMKLIDEKEFISISELTERFEVSHMTIRRDIEKLEAESLVESVVGGVKKSMPSASEPLRHQKEKIRREQKQAIARAAEPLIDTAKVIYLDAGSTSAQLAYRLKTRDDLTILTNDLAILEFFMTHGLSEVYSTGGKLDRENGSFVGQRAADSISQFNIDLAFISTSSFNSKGLATSNEGKVAVKRAVADVANRCILLADSDKYGNASAHRCLPLTTFETIITDCDLTDTDKEEMEMHCSSVIRAE
ncbi:deoR family transcriptional regulator [Vibrio ishigakensis]|uniref:DeoR family transcriptional regulator n=1 Tax=Vibrio ishigakensis TaxID=1481914 RepID=A0A0B8Q518_9VIBR|nr:deoR family transcriptional regulator [Vibrio ishigakensis]